MWLTPDSELPKWVGELMNGALQDHAAPECRGAGSSGPPGTDSVSVVIRSTADWMHVSATMPGALNLPRAAFEQATRDLYTRVAAAVMGFGHVPVRYWNFIPDINAEIDAGLERYMAFNVGRFHAFTEWRRADGGFDPSTATATGVGVQAPDLGVHCLSSAAGGQPVENPRQVSPSRYSSRYGPRPPCFARATRVGIHGTPMLLIGGTASIVGEVSMHAGDVGAQASEAIDNIEALIGNAAAPSPAPLDRLRDARVYVRESASAAQVRDILLDRCPALESIEFVHAQICRRELLVEIEGVADLS
jgi:chorismate lyase / 3-hydroxybenzoate synthase